jgi:hypothetical protein
MATSVKILFRSNPLVGGINTIGSSSQAKQTVVAEVVGTTASGLMSLTPKELGLASVDAVVLAETVFHNTSSVPAVATVVVGQYLRGTSQMLLTVQSTATQVAVADAPVTLRVVAYGDSAQAPEFISS